MQRIQRPGTQEADQRLPRHGCSRKRDQTIFERVLVVRTILGRTLSTGRGLGVMRLGEEGNRQQLTRPQRYGALSSSTRRVGITSGLASWRPGGGGRSQLADHAVASRSTVAQHLQARATAPPGSNVSRSADDPDLPSAIFNFEAWRAWRWCSWCSWAAQTGPSAPLALASHVGDALPHWNGLSRLSGVLSHTLTAVPA